MKINNFCTYGETIDSSVSEYISLIARNIYENESVTSQDVDYPWNEHVPVTGCALIKIQQRKQQNILQIEEESMPPPEGKEQNTLKSFPDIADLNKILRTGVKVFSTPCKLFIFNSLRQWKKKGKCVRSINHHNRVSQSITF